MNRLRSYFADHQARKAQKRLQSAIVTDYRDDIVGLIAHDGATLSEVAAAVRADGEPVLEPGFKAAILQQIGTVKDIRAGRLKAIAVKGAAIAVAPPAPKSAAHPAGSSNAIPSLDDDDDDGFASRRSRG